LWETWHGEEESLDTFTILTTDANASVSPTHDRMPVILDPADYATWLDPAKSADGGLLHPYAADPMTATAVSTYVNNAHHQGLFASPGEVSCCICAAVRIRRPGERQPHITRCS
jgi:putative SOS response-associated peptidase YedK